MIWEPQALQRESQVVDFAARANSRPSQAELAAGVNDSNTALDLRIAVRAFALAIAFLIFVFGMWSWAFGADNPVQVSLDASKAAPRQVEPQTETVILRDYRFAWSSMTQALEANTLDPLDGPFAGEAKKWITDRVNGQRQSGLSSHYLNQSHKVQAIFYSPEGDLIELHDTAQYQMQVLDGSKSIHDEQVTMHYVVLMTPASDRWVVRQLQAVEHF